MLDLLPTYSAQEYVLEFDFKDQLQSYDPIVCSTNGDFFSLNLSSDVTGAFEANTITYQARVSNALGFSKVIAIATFKVLPSFKNLQHYDSRSHNKRTLEAIKAYIEGYASQGLKKYRINNRELESLTVDELLRFKDHYEKLVINENRIKKQTTFQPIRVRWN
ncbi:MAG: hypothetical protein KC646_10220 [Candidatus Cloacimonetes bacterium]|nr:hypothetical protein [Candidatus Cloacimonadota bacterium]